MKPKFTEAIVRIPCKNMVLGLTQAGLGAPDYHKAVHQHNEYVKALKECGLGVLILPADESFPDSTFIEDTALLTPEVAIITNPGAASRKGETNEIRKVIDSFYKKVKTIQEPGTIKAGDIMMIGSFFYVGLSRRTNAEGARQLLEILRLYGMGGQMVELKEFLHLKSGLSYLEENRLLISGEFIQMREFTEFEQLRLPKCESYAANSLWINDRVLIPSGYPGTLAKIQEAGYKTIVLNVSEFRKLDGGLSCLSLRF